MAYILLPTGLYGKVLSQSLLSRRQIRTNNIIIVIPKTSKKVLFKPCNCMLKNKRNGCYVVFIQCRIYLKARQAKAYDLKIEGAPSQACTTVIGLSHLCGYNVLYFRQFSLHTLALQFRILQNVEHPSSSSTLLKLTKHTSIVAQS